MSVRTVEAAEFEGRTVEHGVLGIYGVAFSRADHFCDEHGDHIFESTEFDVYAGGATFEEAFFRFADRLLDYARELIELDDVTPDERAQREVLAIRLVDLAKVLESERSDRSLWSRVRASARELRDAGGSRNEWSVQSTQSVSLAT